MRGLFAEDLQALFNLADLGDLDLLLAVLLGDFAGDLHLGGAGAEILVETLADVAGEVIEGGFVSVLDLDNVLAGIGLLEGALGALAFTGDTDVFGEA